MTFDQFKNQVFKIARRYKKVYLIPGNDTLRVFFEKGLSPEEVIDNCFRRKEN